MSNELYYRGSEEYAVAVKNQLRRMELQGIHDTKKIAYSIQNMEYGIRTDIRKSTYAIVASQEMLRQTFNQGFDSINNTLELGFGNMSAKLSEVKEAIYQVGDKICSRLDEIHDIVNNPLLTASREFYRRALKNYQNGYYADALAEIKQAVEKNKTDYISWQLMGEIYLYGAGKYDNVINLDEAEKAFENAAKYIDADLKDSDDAKQLGMIIYYELGYTRFLQSNDLLVWGNESESIEMLSKSEESFETACNNFDDYKLNLKMKQFDYQAKLAMKPFNVLDYIKNGFEFEEQDKEKEFDGQDKENEFEVFYYNKILFNLAKDKHFRGKDGEALYLISETIDADINSALIFSTDKDFESIWGEIENLIEEKRKPMIKKIEEVRNKISELEFTQEGKNLVLSEYDSITDGYKDAPFLSLVEIIRNPKWVNFYDEKKKEIDIIKQVVNDLPILFDDLPKKRFFLFEKDGFGNICSGDLDYLDLTYGITAASLDDLTDKSYTPFYVRCSKIAGAYLNTIMETDSFHTKKLELNNKYGCRGSFRALVECIKDDLDKQMKFYNIKGIKELSDTVTNYIEVFNQKKITLWLHLAIITAIIIAIIIGIIRCVA